MPVSALVRPDLLLQDALIFHLRVCCVVDKTDCHLVWLQGRGWFVVLVESSDTVEPHKAVDLAGHVKYYLLGPQVQMLCVLEHH
jgi:hypothetical protein